MLTTVAYSLCGRIIEKLDSLLCQAHCNGHTYQQATVPDEMPYPCKTSLKITFLHFFVKFVFEKMYLTEAISYSPFFKVPSAFTFFTSLFGMGRGALHVAIITNLHCKISEIFLL